MSHPYQRERRGDGDSASTTDTTDSGIHSNAHGASIIQVETLGKLGLLVILAMFLVIVALAFFTGRTDGLGQARAESVDDKVRLMGNRVTVLEYDVKNICAQLIVKNIIEACH